MQKFHNTAEGQNTMFA
jgi:hypothetical protein